MQIFTLIRHPHLSLTVLTQPRRAAERNETQPDRHSVIGLRRIDSTVPPRAYLNLTPFTLKASGPELCNTSNAILPNPAQEHGSAISVIALFILMCYEVIMYCLAIRCVLERANKIWFCVICGQHFLKAVLSIVEIIYLNIVFIKILHCSQWHWCE